MENKKNITVFGATGKIGIELLKLLSAAGIPTIAVTRNKAKAIEIPHVKWIEGDMANKKTLPGTMDDSTSVFLLSSQSPGFVQEQNNVVLAAVEHGVRHIVKLSSGAADKNSLLHIPKVHGEVEEFLKISGIGWTMLRPNGMMQNWLGDLAQTVKEEGKIYEATGDGKRAHVDLRDVAETAFKILMNPGEHNGKTYLLTSDEAINYKQVANLISNTLGKKIEFIPITSDKAWQEMEQKGMPQWAIKTFIAYDEAQRNGETNFISKDVREILQRPARTAEAFIKEHAGYFK